jgi:adenylate kinase family enzyme
MQRISIIGTSGSGKTTLAKQISQRLTIPHIELDYLHWQPNWVEIADHIFRDQVSQSLSGNSWVVDGNYSQVRDIVWEKADTIIWLDYSVSVILNRLIWRTLQRVLKKQEVCNGNRETWQTTFSKDSVILYAVQTYQQRRREYLQLFTQPEYSHLQIIRLTSPQTTENWLLDLDNSE